ncbi:hypothetical protein J6590_075750 [Homalodisca vitripennis]|nr:hypothetical protein J6590_075750 [Homalodisca vitripennis]
MGVTIETPHERLFKHARRYFYGTSQQQWLMNPGPELVMTQVRTIPEYARIKNSAGREAFIATPHLAAPPETILQNKEPLIIP